MQLFRRPLHKVALWLFNPDVSGIETVQSLPICWSPDAQKGALYQQGIFTWEGHAFKTADSPFAYPQNTPPVWVAHAHSFEWLLHMRSTAAFAKCIGWIIDWHDTYGTAFSSDVWRLDITAHRLCAWLSHYDALVSDIPYAERQDFHKIIATHYRYLEYWYTHRVIALTPPTQIQCIHALRALICAGLSLGDTTIHIKQMMGTILTILDDIMDADGFVQGHLPTHISVLKTCLYLRSTLHKMQAGTPEVLDVYVDKMWRVVRFFYNVNMDFAHMAGATGINHQYHMIKRLCKNERGVVPCLIDSGYMMHKTVGITLYLDAQNRRGYATDNGGLLGITVHCQKQPLFVACGHTHNMQAVSRYSAAHNTLVINDTNSVPIGKLQNPTYAKNPYIACTVSTKHSTAGDWAVIQAAHTGYESAFAVRVERKVGVHTDGNTVQCRDSVIFTGDFAQAVPMDIAIRLHLHPSVKATKLQSGQVLLTFQKKNTAIFEAKNSKILLEPSYYIDENFVYMPTEQIVLQCQHTPTVLGEKDIHIDWSLTLDVS